MRRAFIVRFAWSFVEQGFYEGRNARTRRDEDHSTMNNTLRNAFTALTVVGILALGACKTADESTDEPSTSPAEESTTPTTPTDPTTTPTDTTTPPPPPTGTPTGTP
jgi:hypothetical protein